MLTYLYRLRSLALKLTYHASTVFTIVKLLVDKEVQIKEKALNDETALFYDTTTEAQDELPNEIEGQEVKIAGEAGQG